MNKSSTLKKDLLTNLDVALSTVQLKKKPRWRWRWRWPAVNNVKCSQLFALLVEKKRWFLSNRLAKNLFIAASVFNPANVTTGKSLKVKTFPGLSAWEGFLLRGEIVETAGRGLLHSAFASITFIPAGRMLCWTPAYFMSGCPWCVSEHILDPSDLWYPS